MTATTRLWLHEQAESAYAAMRREQREKEAVARADIEKRAVEETRKLIAATLGVDYVDAELNVYADGWPVARFTIDSIPFRAAYHESEFSSGWSLYVESPCTRDGCLKQDEPALIEVRDLGDVGQALHTLAEHSWSMHCAEIGAAPYTSPEERALDDAARGHADALNVVSLLEDQRSLIKAACIKSMIGTPNEITGKAHSASSAEAIVEAHPDYMAHRDKQRAAEVERWRSLGVWEAAKLKARLAGAGQ